MKNRIHINNPKKINVEIPVWHDFGKASGFVGLMVDAQNEQLRRDSLLQDIFDNGKPIKPYIKPKLSIKQRFNNWRIKRLEDKINKIDSDYLEEEYREYEY